MVAVRVPATVGNVGPGFDTLGLCLDTIHDDIQITFNNTESQIQVVSSGQSLLPIIPKKNITWIAAQHFFSQFQEQSNTPITVHIRKNIPECGGLGGSAAAAVAGAYAAAHLLGREKDKASVLKSAQYAEAQFSTPHLDNIAPALLGGLTFVLKQDISSIYNLPIQKDTWWFITFSPTKMALATKTSRSLLPKTTKPDVWRQSLANSIGVTQALASGDVDLLRKSMHDPWATPYRFPHTPLYQTIQQTCLEAGAIAATLSGSGPTIFAITNSKDQALQVQKSVLNAIAPHLYIHHIAQTCLRGVHFIEDFI